jgi:hypothetical protein
MIRTEIPFGYLFIFLFVAVSLVLGFVVVCLSFLTPFRKFRWFSAGSYLAYIGLIIVVAVINVTGEPEWNPEIKNDREVVGIWTDPHHKLELTADHHFTYLDHEVTTTGVWARDDWNLYLKNDASVSNDSARLFRFIEYQGHYRVLTNPPGDPDGWDGDYGLSRK